MLGHHHWTVDVYFQTRYKLKLLANIKLKLGIIITVFTLPSNPGPCTNAEKLGLSEHHRKFRTVTQQQKNIKINSPIYYLYQYDFRPLSIYFTDLWKIHISKAVIEDHSHITVKSISWHHCHKVTSLSSPWSTQQTAIVLNFQNQSLY